MQKGKIQFKLLLFWLVKFSQTRKNVLINSQLFSSSDVTTVARRIKLSQPQDLCNFSQIRKKFYWIPNSSALMQLLLVLQKGFALS
jgi:hypothetical protein